ncbi:MAG TPA: response regulator [Spirochaetota bacterium]|nr:response regulator [Spirochaetota bacterium]HOD13152.1 response regulator [Spirochaetota bacterium]HPG49041.1 response regulator [Spirochaetota bacterium]HPN10509.1 response regulator [Spirochaetota bacterium]HQL81688.1 response regulator [Spirochaetota bacterium]
MSHKILLVEDDKTTILLLNKFIRDLGYNIIHTVPTGEEAIHEIIKFSPDVVLMDIILGGQIDGIETARQINDIHSIPVIFITSSSDSNTLKRALTTNPSGYIVKPVDKKELKSAIELAILRHEMEDRLKESELRFFTILNSIGDAVFVMDTADQITYVNPNAERITEFTIDKLLGKHFNEVMNIRYNGLTGSTDVMNDEIHYNYFITQSGRKVPVDFSVSPISDINGERSGSVIILRDDTERVNSEMKLKESFVQIKKAVGGIIQAMAQTLETRDPYTAGHQRRVANIAKTIAEEMQLPEKHIEGIFMAGIIHDLGKICIPTEILSKPGRLSAIEFDLIKTHPQIGYDILKTIEFPWPLAEMVLQHHEWCNGSGYPRGLTNNDILIGARIICVADVVEAMASDRPYRPALGIEDALEEITNKKGKHFDSDVVEICIKIFREKHYRMP